MLGAAVRNGSILLASQAITWTASLIITGALGRHLGAVGFGNLYLAASFSIIFGLFVESGLDQQIVRAVARDRSVAGPYLATAVLIKTIVAIVAYPVMLVTVALLGYDAQFQRVVAVYGLMLLSVGLSASLGSVYQGSQSMMHSAIGTVLEKVFVALAVLVLFALNLGILEVATVMVIGSAAAGIWKALMLGRVVSGPWRPDRATARALLGGAGPFLLYAILGSVYYRVDSILLSKLTDGAVVGWYAAAYRLFDTMVFLPSIVSAAVMFPILAQLSLVSETRLRLAVGKGIQIMSVVGVPICVGLLIVADPIIRLVYGGTEFQPAADALRWLMPGLLLLYLNSILTVALLSVNGEKRLTVAAGLSCVLNLTMNWILIPRYQHVAAAAVTSLTELFLFGYLIAAMPKGVIPARAFVALGKSGLAAGVMAAVIIPLQSWPVISVVLIGAATYTGVGLVLGIVAADDLRALRASVARRSGRSTRPSEA